MGLTLVPASLGLQYGFAGTVELGINTNSFKLTVKPEIDEYLAGTDGQAICNAIGDPMGDLEISGEFRSSAGVVVAAFATAFVPVNGTTFWGRSQGGFYLKEGSLEIANTAWKKVETKFQSRWNIP